MPASESTHAAATSSDGARPTTAVHAARDFLEDAADTRRTLFDSWVAGAEATLKASFELQNASLAAGLALLDATSASQRTIYQEWDGAARRAQSAALDAFRAQVRAADRLTTPPTRN